MTDTPADPLLELWRDLRHYILTAFAAFGEPRTLAAAGMIAAAEHDRIRQWLRGCEEALRRLLFIDARALAAPAPKPSQRQRPRSHHPRAARR